jgi:hypothetical protein
LPSIDVVAQPESAAARTRTGRPARRRATTEYGIILYARREGQPPDRDLLRSGSRRRAAPVAGAGSQRTRKARWNASVHAASPRPQHSPRANLASCMQHRRHDIPRTRIGMTPLRAGRQPRKLATLPPQVPSAHIQTSYCSIHSGQVASNAVRVWYGDYP